MKKLNLLKCRELGDMAVSYFTDDGGHVGMSFVPAALAEFTAFQKIQLFHFYGFSFTIVSMFSD